MRAEKATAGVIAANAADEVAWESALRSALSQLIQGYICRSYYSQGEENCANQGRDRASR